VWGYPITPAIFLAAALLLLGNALLSDLGNVSASFRGLPAPDGSGTTILVFVILTIGIPVFWFWKRSRAMSDQP
jgi:hypothetical protein